MSFGGFGIGPGDIILFTGFAVKVIKALKDEGGAKTEFQVAERQCQGFLDVITELKSLDLSGIPESFRTKLEEYSMQTASDIQIYRKTIERYEKSMGEDSARGWFSSAPRKVQWAFSAAQDLAAFRQSLLAQLDLVKIVIQSSLLALASQSSLRASISGPPSALALRSMRSPMPHGSMLSWDSNPMLDRLFYHKVDYMTDLVYGRLLTRPGLSLAEKGTVHTLPDDVHMELARSQLPLITEEAASPTVPASTGGEFSDIEQPRVGFDRPTIRETETTTLVDGLNEYLRELNLDPLSVQEAEFTNQMQHQGAGVHKFHGLLTDSPGPEESKGPSTTTGPAKGDGSGSSKTKSRTNGRFSRSFNFDFGIDPFSALGLAANIVQIISLSARIASSVRQVYDSAPKSPLVDLSRRLMQYSRLLQTASEIIRSSVTANQLQELGWEILSDSKEVLDEIEYIVHGLMPKSRHSSMGAIGASLKWEFKKERVRAIMERMESLKSTLSMMLQLHGILLAETNVGSEVLVGATKASTAG